LNLREREYAFGIRKRILENPLSAAGRLFKNFGGFSAKQTAEGVSSDIGRWISILRPRLDRGGGDRVRRPELEGPAAAPWPVMAGARGLRDLGR